MVRWLKGCTLFAECDEDDLGRLAMALHPVDFQAGERLLRQGEPADSFAIVMHGAVRISSRHEGGEVMTYGSVGGGSVLGEIALMAGTMRTATAVAESDVAALVGSSEGFIQMYSLPGVAERVMRTAAQRLAEQADPVRATVKDQRVFWLRPLLPGDRDELAGAIAGLTDRTRRMRFFTAGAVPPRIVDYLVDLDYLNHFAWVAEAGAAGRGVGVARFIRHLDLPGTAEVAVAVADDHQGLGLGTTLLGAVATAAEVAGVERLEASVLRENTAMRSLLDRADAQWGVAEPGVLETTLDVRSVQSLIPGELADRLRPVAERTLAAALAPLGCDTTGDAPG